MIISLQLKHTSLPLKHIPPLHLMGRVAEGAWLGRGTSRANVTGIVIRARVRGWRTAGRLCVARHCGARQLYQQTSDQGTDAAGRGRESAAEGPYLSPSFHVPV